MSDVVSNPTYAFKTLREIAFSTEQGSHFHVPHDEIPNCICFTDGKYNHQVLCHPDNSLEFTNYTVGATYTLGWDVGSILFTNMINRPQ